MAHMYPQLVRASGNRFKPQSGTACRCMCLVGVALIPCLARFANDVIYLLQRASFPVANERSIDGVPCIVRSLRDGAIYRRGVAFENFSGCEGITEQALYFFGAGKDEQT